MILKGNIPIPDLTELKNQIYSIKDNLKDTGSSLEVGDSLSTVDCENFKPHKLSSFCPYYSKLFESVKRYYLESGQSFVRPHKISKVFDTGFNSVDYLDSHRDFLIKYDRDSDYYNEEVTKDLFLIDNSWINVHWKGGKTLPHAHGNSIKYVCAYYLNVPENSGRFKFFNEDHWEYISVKTGDFIIFPSTLIHSTEENISNEERIVLTTNIVLKEYGH
jgi:hypothetical protein|tara:strand:+ start:792 stop:1445 length:654 start_codon:yes stop_codon:yes gene_type:complete